MSAKSIMIQGTMSNAGKSFVAAGFCRIFHQDGYRTAPFKSQNMALNSYITRDGLEMGRAQVMQAEAAGVEPQVEMNPILLKPTSNMGSQVIVNGEVLENMRAMEYYRRKPEFIPAVKQAYEKLAADYDVIVLEGAGSPAEINLMENDIVNMGMARIAGSPVLLVADIDRGGVFASVYGTVMLLPPEQRAYIKGILINKFRGDVEILRPGLDKIRELTGIPVLGVIPMEHFDLDEEDSLSERLTEEQSVAGQADVAVIRLPKISNFTDFFALENRSGVHVRYVSSAEKLGRPDLIFLPGTKNTLEDLKWLRESGLEASICRLHGEGVPVFGICGGYQMMGQTISDPEGVEAGGSLRGMGLLQVSTVFSGEKTRTRMQGRVLQLPDVLSDPAAGGDDKPLSEVSGYEIHMGVSHLQKGAKAFLQLSDGREDGCVSADGLACGTYLHGIFDEGEMAERLLAWLRQRKGIRTEQPEFSRAQIKEQEYDRLAALLRRSVDMKAIYTILEKGMEA